MGYTTDFDGHFTIDKPLDDETFNLINGLANTRRMGRKGLDPEYGEEGELYYNPDSDDCGQEHDENIINYNVPPRTQPSLWLQWIVGEDKQTIEWDGCEKFYKYIEWIKYLIDKILEPRGYKVSGVVHWAGEGSGDKGKIEIKDNKVSVYEGRIQYVEKR